MGIATTMDRFETFDKRRRVVTFSQEIKGQRIKTLINLMETHKVITLSIFLMIFATSTALANSESFSSVLTGSSFMGTWEDLSKFDILGRILSFLIVFFSITGVVGTFTIMMIDLAYLGGKGFFDQVYEYQEQDEGTGALGMKGLFQSTMSGSRGTGPNAIVGVGMSLMVNLKKLSSYNPTRRDPALDEDDTMLAYMLKTFVPRLTILLMFVLAFNGTLAKSFATVAEAAAVGIDHAVSIDLATTVDKWAVRGQGYEFTIGRSGTPEAKFGEKVAKKLYTMIISRSGASDSISRNAIGLATENWVYVNILGNSNGASERLSHMKKLVSLTDGQELASDDVSNFRLEIVINGNEGKMAGEVAEKLNKPTESISTFLEGAHIEVGKQTLYVHVFVLKGKTSQTEFFVKPTQKGSTRGG